MKKVCVLLGLLLLLTGCSGKNVELEKAMELRAKLLKAESVTFGVDISADYGDTLQLFSMDCRADDRGNIGFTVTAPETISGITGTISDGNGALTFDDTALQFGLLTDEQLSPISAPWIMLKALRSGYLTAAGTEGESIRLTIDDSYEEDALQLDIWLNDQDLPQRAEVLYDGKNILSLVIKSFQIL